MKIARYRIDNEIHLETVAVDGTQDMHQPGFDAELIHPADNLHYA